jgi:omega-hydroxy-beta-dihydromenaquinone-9 sulfotransferase
MYFNHRLYRRLAHLSVFGHSPIGRPRAAVYVFFFAVLPIVELVNAVCFWLDDVLFPGYRRRDVDGAVFIVGNPRSGTTLMHRLMAKDSRRFFTFHSWEIVFPAVVQKMVLALCGKVDRRLGDVGERAIRRFEDARFEEFNKMHRVGLFLPEEDDKLLIHTLSSLDLLWFFPYAELGRFARFDEAVPDRDQARIMKFYTACVKRQAYFRGTGVLLSKNPLFSGKLRALRKYFPSGRFIYMVRNPLDVIPSMLDMAQKIWERTQGARAPAAMEEEIYETLKFFYDYPLRVLDEVPPGSCAIVKYDDLVREPQRVVETVYARLGLEATPEFRELLRVEAERILAYRSEHAYSLGEQSITRERIVSDLKHVFERFGFDPRSAAA